MEGRRGNSARAVQQGGGGLTGSGLLRLLFGTPRLYPPACAKVSAIPQHSLHRTVPRGTTLSLVRRKDLYCTNPFSGRHDLEICSGFSAPEMLCSHFARGLEVPSAGRQSSSIPLTAPTTPTPSHHPRTHPPPARCTPHRVSLLVPGAAVSSKPGPWTGSRPLGALPV